MLEIPPADDGSITGTVMDCWQVRSRTSGRPGVDKGQGGKYLILPPGYAEQLPDGYIPMASDTYSGFALLRSILRGGSDADIAAAVAYGRRIKLYPLAQADDPPSTTFVDAINVVFDATIPYDRRFFVSLDRMIQREPWLPRDKAMIGIVRSVGIEKHKPFDPDATQAMFDEAAGEAHAWLDAKYESSLSPGFYEGSRWSLPASLELITGQQTFFARPQLLSRRRSRRGLQHGVLRPQASRDGVVLPDGDQRQRRVSAPGRQHLPADRARRCTRHPVLVGNDL